ncbi:hypothetical protein, partial [Escherichia coli]|uniref:hypothetical protein n=1 Tax=Escherichia coli TaxID=562 RepID=UPI001AD8AE95
FINHIILSPLSKHLTTLLRDVRDGTQEEGDNVNIEASLYVNNILDYTDFRIIVKHNSANCICEHIDVHLYTR